jgi:hypothetical protein
MASSSEKLPLASLSTVNLLVIPMKKICVFCEVGTEDL